MTEPKISTTPGSDDAVRHRPLTHVFLLAALGSANVGLTAYLLSAYLPEDHHPTLLIISLIFLWTVGACSAAQGRNLSHIIVLMVGFVWGFMLTMSVAIDIQNMRSSTEWIPFLLAMLLLPIAAFIAVLPVYFLRSRITSAVPLLCLAAVLVGLDVAACKGLLPFTYKLVAPDANYDLAAGEVTFSPSPVVAGSDYSVAYSVRNLGPSTVPGKTYDVEFYINGRLAAFDRSTSTLNPGSSNTYQDQYHANLQPGVNRYRLVVDPDNRLIETDKSNNVVEGTFDVVSSAPQQTPAERP